MQVGLGPNVAPGLLKAHPCVSPHVAPRLSCGARRSGSKHPAIVGGEEPQSWGTGTGWVSSKPTPGLLTCPRASPQSPPLFLLEVSTPAPAQCPPGRKGAGSLSSHTTHPVGDRGRGLVSNLPLCTPPPVLLHTQRLWVSSQDVSNHLRAGKPCRGAGIRTVAFPHMPQGVSAQPTPGLRRHGVAGHSAHRARALGLSRRQAMFL